VRRKGSGSMKARVVLMTVRGIVTAAGLGS
jgi:hypothetical protein